MNIIITITNKDIHLTKSLTTAHLFHICRHVFIVIWFDIHCPFMSMAIFLTLLAKVPGYISIHQRLHYC